MMLSAYHMHTVQCTFVVFNVHHGVHKVYISLSACTLCCAAEFFSLYLFYYFNLFVCIITLFAFNRPHEGI